MKRPSKPAFLNLAEWSAIAAASASRAFTELLSAFNRKFGEMSGDRIRIHLINPGDRPEGSPGASGQVAVETG